METTDKSFTALLIIAFVAMGIACVLAWAEASELRPKPNNSGGNTSAPR